MRNELTKKLYYLIFISDKQRIKNIKNMKQTNTKYRYISAK